MACALRKSLRVVGLTLRDVALPVRPRLSVERQPRRLVAGGFVRRWFSASPFDPIQEGQTVACLSGCTECANAGLPEKDLTP